MRGRQQTSRRFARSITVLPDVFDFVSVFLAAAGIGDDTAHDINLAVEELFTNAVKYSASADPVEISLSIELGSLQIVFLDSGGKEFDPTRFRSVNHNRAVSEVRPGGLGIHLIRCVMDDLQHSYMDGTNVITMTKRLEQSDV